MAKKITFIGAGSFGFTRSLVRDLLTFPAFEDATISLMDIDPSRLDFARRACEKIVETGCFKATVEATLDRKQALQGADGVVCTILSGGVDVWRHDIEIPKKYGVDTNVGDTRGPSGIFRFLRTAPAMMDICRDIERYCPDAVFLNYTNPMAMLCRLMQGQSAVKLTGLCHSVQGTARMLSEWLGVPNEEVTYLCAGINHQAWYLEFKHNNQDMYPRLRELVNDPAVYRREIVRNEMFRHLDYYVTESSGHNSEYNPWFRKRPDLIEKYCLHGENWNPGQYAYILNEYMARENTWKAEFESWMGEPLDLTRGEEFAAYIFNAIFGDGQMYVFNGNVRNFGLIDNLPEGCCVEVPVLASRNGLSPMHVGPLPDHLAILNNVSSRIEELAVQGCIEGDPRMVFHAICMDPLTSAVCSLQEIKDMVDEMFRQNADYLPQFKRLS